MTTIPIENHPFRPFLPNQCKTIMLGSFPPAEKRWCMPFYYPNFTNDMWRIMGLIFFNDKDHFVDLKSKTFRLDDIVAFLTQQKIGLFDTATAVRRLKNTASDKDLEVVQPTNLAALLDSAPTCENIVTTGQKATDVLCNYFQISQQPKVGEYVTFYYNTREIRFFRMPSSSRAYPLAIEKKAAAYKNMFKIIQKS